MDLKVCDFCVVQDFDVASYHFLSLHRVRNSNFYLLYQKYIKSRGFSLARLLCLIPT